MKKYVLLFLLLVNIIIFSACSSVESQEDRYVNIPDVEDYPILNIQVVDEIGAVTDSTSKVIADDDKIEELINSLEQIEVTTPSKKEMLTQMDQLKTEGYYMFILSDETSSKIYAFNISKEGSILFQSESENEIIYSSKEKQPDLLEEFEDTLEMNF